MSKKKREYRTNSKENYLAFIKEHKISESELPYAKYCKNLEINNWMWVEYALRTGSKVTLPFGFGSIAVNKKKLKLYKEYNGKKYVNLRVDWARTRKAGKIVYHTNEHSDGYNFKWLWFNSDSKLFLADLYVFKPGRYASRAINKYVRRPKSEFKDLYMEWMTHK